MQRMVLLFLVITQAILSGVNFSFIPDSFELFVANTITPEERNSFSRYYEKLSKTIHEDALDQQRSTRRYFRQKALDFLELHHHASYEQIHNFISDVAFLDQTYDNDRAKLQAYLLWYGAYQEFDITKKQVKQKVAVSKDKAPEKHNALESTSTLITETSELITDASDTVSGWFSFSWSKKDRKKEGSVKS